MQNQEMGKMERVETLYMLSHINTVNKNGSIHLYGIIIGASSQSCVERVFTFLSRCSPSLLFFFPF